MFVVVLALAGAMLAAAPGTASDKYEPQAVVGAEKSLAEAGKVLGAASACNDIDRARVRTAILKLESLIDKGVDDNRQYYAAKNILAKGLDEGKAAIKKRETNCQRAAEDLSALEQRLGL